MLASDSSSSSSNVVRVANKAGWMDLSWWKNKAKQARELEEKRQRKQMLLKRQRTLSENISEQNSSKRWEIHRK